VLFPTSKQTLPGMMRAAALSTQEDPRPKWVRDLEALTEEG
jgi:hypothetical protein